MQKASTSIPDVPEKKKDINYGEILTIIAVLGGIYYGMKKNKGFITTGVYAMTFGIAAAFTGNMINKYQTEN